MFAILMAEKMSGTSVKIIKNEVGCRDDTVPKLLKQEGTARRIESMQQSSSQCLLVSTEYIERERKDSEHRKNTQNIHNITTIHKPHGLEK